MSSTGIQPAAPAAPVPVVVPRAEFRVFGPHVADAVRERIWNGRTVLGQKRTMPTEIYLLSRETEDFNVKIREGFLDIKVRIGLTKQGYEIFQPQAKFPVPAVADALRVAFRALRVDVPLEHDLYLEADIVALARRQPRLAIVAVDKVRWGFTIDGVICEYAHVYFNGALVQSACVESERYDAMEAVIEELGLTGAANTSYVRQAGRIVGLS